MNLIHKRYEIRIAEENYIPDLNKMLFSLREHMFKKNSSLWKYTKKRTSEQPIFYRKMLKNPNIQLLTVYDLISNSNIGMGFGWIIENEQYEPNKYGQIGDIWIAPKHRGKGLCKNMILKLLNFFNSAGIESLSLEYVHGNHEAEQVWEKLGFKKVLITARANLSDINKRYS